MFLRRSLDVLLQCEIVIDPRLTIDEPDAVLGASLREAVVGLRCGIATSALPVCLMVSRHMVIEHELLSSCCNHSFYHRSIYVVFSRRSLTHFRSLTQHQHLSTSQPPSFSNITPTSLLIRSYTLPNHPYTSTPSLPSPPPAQRTTTAPPSPYPAVRSPRALSRVQTKPLRGSIRLRGA